MNTFQCPNSYKPADYFQTPAQRDASVYEINAIGNKQIYNTNYHYEDNYDNVGFAPMSKSYFTNVITPEMLYKTMPVLIDAGIIETNRSYEKGKRPKGYRLNEFLATQDDWVPYDFTNKTYLRNIERCIAAADMRLTRLQRHVLHNHKKLNYYGPTDCGLHSKAIQKICCGDFRVVPTKPNHNGRMFHSLTQLKKEFRQYLTVNGSELYSVDVKCCQLINVAHFVKWLADFVFCERNDEFAKKVKTYHLIHTNNQYNKPKYNINSTQTNPNPHTQQQPPYYVVLFCPNILLGEIDKFLGLCENGDIYETIANAAGLDILSNRKKVKQQFFAGVIYGKPNYSSGKIHDAFKTLFPNLLELLKRYKALGGTRGYANLPINAQRMESRIMSHAWKYLFREYPSMFWLPIHDEIVTTQDNIAIVEKAIHNAFAAHAMKAQTDISYWGRTFSHEEQIHF